MTRSIIDMLDARFKGAHIVIDRYKCTQKILNGDGDSEFTIHWRVKSATEQPIYELEVYTTAEESADTFEEFCSTLSGRGVSVQPIEELRIEGENIFVYRIKFPQAINQYNPYEFILKYRINKFSPLNKADNNVGCQIAVPTEWTGRRVELPLGWTIDSRRSECDRKLLEDNLFHEIDGEGFEWVVQNPQTHSFYDIYFTASRHGEHEVKT